MTGNDILTRMPTKVYIRPKARISAQGRHNYTTHNGQKMGKYKANGANFYFSILEKPGTGVLNIGFDEVVENPYFSKTKKDARLPSQWEHTDVYKNEYITMQTLMEIKHNKPKDFYNPAGVREYTMYRGKDAGRTYLQTFRRILGDGENTVDNSKPEDQIFYLAALRSGLIANSKKEADYSPNARFYISYTEEDEGAKAAKNESVLKANAYLADLQNKRPAEESFKFAIILKLVRGKGISPKSVTNKLFNYINDTTNEQDSNILLFTKLYEEYIDPLKQDVFYAKYLLQQLVNYRIVSDKLQRYTWTSRVGSNLETIARTTEQAVLWLADEDNKAHVEELEAELKAKL